MHHSARLLTLIIASILLSGCCWLCGSQELSCIHPPISKVEADSKILIKLGAELEKIKGNVAAEFGNKITQTFAQVEDKNAALYLLLNAIDCYLQRGTVGEDIAKKLAVDAVIPWKTAIGQASSDANITSVHISKIAESAQPAALRARLREFGILN
jgi:hypothetical protein